MGWDVVDYKERSSEFVPESIVQMTGYMLFHEGFLAAETADDKSRFVQMARDFGDRCVGITDLGLDGLLGGDPQKEQEFLHLVKLVKRRLAGFGEKIPREYTDQSMPNYLRGEFLVVPWYWTLLDAIEALITGQPIPPVSPETRRRWRPHRKARGWQYAQRAQAASAPPPAKFVLADFIQRLDQIVRKPS